MGKLVELRSSVVLFAATLWESQINDALLLESRARQATASAKLKELESRKATSQLLHLGVHPSTASRLLCLLGGDKDVAARLLQNSRETNTEKAEQWHYQAVINEILKDRGTLD